MSKVQCILTDIEGTTTDISFVYNTLFPYFREHLPEWRQQQTEDVQNILEATQRLITDESGGVNLSRDELFDQLLKWSLEDRKVTPLKELQGIIWKQGFESGALKGHVYPDVAPALNLWKNQGIHLAVFSSGSVGAQRQLFEHSVSGNLTGFFSHYFDTKTGTKRDAETYKRIAEIMGFAARNILFLSDVKEELEAAETSGYKTIQLVRPGTAATWKTIASDFTQIA